MNTIVIFGLKINTRCRYIKFTKSSKTIVNEDIVSDILEIKFIDGYTSSDIFNKRVEVIKDKIPLVETKYIKIVNPETVVSGVRLRLLTSQDFIFNQYIVGEIDDFYMDYSEEGCTILIPKLRDARFEEYLCTLEACPYFEVVSSEPRILMNYYGVNLLNSSGEIDSMNNFVFSPKAMYNRYLLSDVMVVASFKNQLKSILNSYGMDLVRYPIDESATTVNRLIYRITEYGAQRSHKSGWEELRDDIQHRTVIEFELSCLDLDIFNDFRTRYQNLDLVSNFTEFQTKDRLDRLITSHVIWSAIPTDFNPDYQQDNQGNAAYSCTFTAELRYYVIYDKVYRLIQSTIVDLIMTNNLRTEGRLGDQVGIVAETETPIPVAEEVVQEFEVPVEQEPEDKIPTVFKEDPPEDIPEWERLRQMK